jgi:hypothetical protein
VQRLIWVEVAGGKPAQVFRALADCTLIDQQDNEVKLADEARIQVAHDSLLSHEQVAAWQQHLAEHGVSPLFQQLGKGVYTLPPDQAKVDRISDFDGYLIEAFALRGRATKLGYLRGPTADDDWFFTYAKRFPTLGLRAVIEFTGNGLPEKNRTVALTGLTFTLSTGSPDSQGSLQLSKVPRILLSECYNDLRLIAAEGTGFDPEWAQE